MLSEFLVELLGSFISISVILQYQKVIPTIIALGAMIYFGGPVSGGHFNPILSLAMYLNQSLTIYELILYIVAQVIGGLMAFKFVKHFSIY